jgi:NAD-dependent SIR2 family protein deacetylase
MDATDVYAEAARALGAARTLLVTAGAGMGVDSGLPDFRGDQGFWNAYPMYERLGLTFVEAANPEHFEGDPAFGWGFYGHRLRLYRDTMPHEGFQILRRLAARFELATFVVTSNVDGQFQKAGFAPEAVCEVHGSIHHLQCTTPCQDDIWPNEQPVEVDETTMRARAVPRCRRCGAVARPNILMFGDYAWLASRTHAQRRRLDAFLAERGEAPCVVVELGAGTGVPTIRQLSEQLGRRAGTTVVRINPREPDIRAPHLSIVAGALAGLSGIERALGRTPRLSRGSDAGPATAPRSAPPPRRTRGRPRRPRSGRRRPAPRRRPPPHRAEGRRRRRSC